MRTIAAIRWAACSTRRIRQPLRVENLRRSSSHLRCARTEEEQAADQLVVVFSLDSNRKAALELDDARQLPVIQQLASDPVIFANRHIPHIIDHETLFGIEQRQRSASLVVERIYRLFEAGGPIERLAESVSRLQLESARETLLQTRLERVVG